MILVSFVSLPHTGSHVELAKDFDLWPVFLTKACRHCTQIGCQERQTAISQKYAETISYHDDSEVCDTYIYIYICIPAYIYILLYMHGVHYYTGHDDRDACRVCSAQLFRSIRLPTGRRTEASLSFASF